MCICKLLRFLGLAPKLAPKPEVDLQAVVYASAQKSLDAYRPKLLGCVDRAARALVNSDTPISNLTFSDAVETQLAKLKAPAVVEDLLSAHLPTVNINVEADVIEDALLEAAAELKTKIAAASL